MKICQGSDHNITFELAVYGALTAIEAQIILRKCGELKEE